LFPFTTPNNFILILGSDQKIGKSNPLPLSPSTLYQHSILNHMKTIFLSPQPTTSKKSQRMKIVLELEEHNLHQFYRFLVFPSMSKVNIHRICELSSVYLLYERSPPTDPISPGRGQRSDAVAFTITGAMRETTGVDSISFPTPPKTPKKSSFKSIFRRNQQIHIGLHPLSSSVLTALFAHNSHNIDEDELALLTPKHVETLMSRWLKRIEERPQRQRQRISTEIETTTTKSNLNLMEFHFQEIAWIARSISMLQQICDDSPAAAEMRTVKRTQRETPYMLSSIQRMRKRLLQVNSLFLSSSFSCLPLVITPSIPSCSLLC
jgi:hypothetical protein